MDDDVETVRMSTWRILPTWVKTITILIGLPAWIIFLVCLVSGAIGSQVQVTAFAAFMMVSLLQIAFVLRAYWRMDL